MSTTTTPERPILAAERLQDELGPLLVLSDIVKNAAWEWKEKQAAFAGGADEHAWFDVIPGTSYCWVPADYEAVHPADALLLGMVAHLERAFLELCHIIEKEYEHAEKNPQSICGDTDRNERPITNPGGAS